MAQANGSHKWLDRNQSAHEDPSSSSSSSSFESPITPKEWENDEVRTQSKSDGKLRIFYKMTSAVYLSWELGVRWFQSKNIYPRMCCYKEGMT